MNSAWRLALACGVALAALPLAEAQSAGSLPILGATSDIVIPLDVSEFVVDPQADRLGSCGQNRFTIESPTRFVFSESTAASTECGEIGSRYALPAGIRTLKLEFSANRSVERPADAPEVPTVPPAPPPPLSTNTRRDALQEVRAAGDDDVDFLSSELFPPDSPSTDFTFFSIPVEVPPESATVNLTWLFEDRGASSINQEAPSFASADTFVAAVDSPRIRLAGHPASFGDVIATDQTVDGNETVTTTLYGVATPIVPGASAPASLVVVLARNAVFTHVVAPDGARIEATALNLTATPGARTVELPASLTAIHGNGTYGIAIVTRAPLPPPPVPAPPATIYPIALALLALPSVPGAFALYSTSVFSRRAVGRFRPTARGLLVLFGTMAVFYLALAAYALFLRLDVMARLPLVSEALLLFALFFLLTVAFAALWYVPGRYATRAMEADIEERRRVQLELERSNRELEHFAYVASHDLQEPLRTIAGFSQLLEQRYGEQLDDKGKSYIHRTVAGSQRMQTLINDLLAYSRVQTQGRPAEPLMLDRVVASVLTDLESVVARTGAKVTADPLPEVRADPSQIAQVFSNLVRNAIKYRHPERQPIVHVSAERGEGEWRFAVRDNGIGIEPEYHEKIFIIFQRLAPRTSNDGGTGLGLAITKKIVERHGGRIWIESKLGEGSTFFFTLPDAGVHLP